MRFLGLLSVATAAISVFKQEFTGKLVNYQHLKVDNKNVNDEVVLAWTTKGEFWISYNQGEDWSKQSLSNVVRVMPHPFANDRVFVFTASQVYYSDDHARSFNVVKLPAQADITAQTFDFNKKDPNYMILHTKEDGCDPLIEKCEKTAWYSRDAGRSWNKMIDRVAICRYAVDLNKDPGRDFVVCQKYKGEDVTNTELVSSSDYFKTSQVDFEKIVGFALDPPFMVVASYSDEDESLLAYVTSDGHTYAPAHLPGDIDFNHKMGYTVIDTAGSTLFLDVTTARDFGDVYKSNANGTDFARILQSVNRSPLGFVDFEKVSIEGVILSNIVENPEDVSAGGSKVLKSRISHSDGAYWDPIPAPSGECDEDDDPESCSLHLHGYTERYDPRNTVDSKAAVGMIISTGNVGESLQPLNEAATYLSDDAGITWSKIADEPKIWEFGDSGAVIVTARYGDVTNTISYSTDEGKTWEDYQFSEEMVQVLNIANIPSDTSRKFVIFTRGTLNKGDKTLAITVRFDSPRKCGRKDFFSWSPLHPRLGEDQCLFGHKIQYARRKPDSLCTIGKHPIHDQPLGTPLTRTQNCKCTREDFECDYNHYLGDNNECKLISGKTVPDKAAQCANGGIYWRDITGYRKISIDTCQGGEELGPKEYFACPGMEKEFEELFHRPPGAPSNDPPGSDDGSDTPPPRSGSFALAFFLFFLFTAVALVGLFIASYFEKSGRIVLGDTEAPRQGIATRVLSTVVGVGSLAVSQIKELADRMLGSVEDRFASRRGVYSRLDDDERARILSEDLSDDELDNPELDNFNLYEDE